VAFLLSAICIFFLDLENPNARNRFAAKFLPLAQICFLMYLGSFALLMLSIAFMGYGANFGADSPITLVFGLVGFIVLLAGIPWVHGINKKARATVPLDAKATARDTFDIDRLLTQFVVGSCLNKTPCSCYFVSAAGSTALGRWPPFLAVLYSTTW
jgi:hypothetical protein